MCRMLRQICKCGLVFARNEALILVLKYSCKKDRETRHTGIYKTGKEDRQYTKVLAEM